LAVDTWRNRGSSSSSAVAAGCALTGGRGFTFAAIPVSIPGSIPARAAADVAFRDRNPLVAAAATATGYHQPGFQRCLAFDRGLFADIGRAPAAPRRVKAVMERVAPTSEDTALATVAPVRAHLDVEDRARRDGYRRRYVGAETAGADVYRG
jgi:hypothetical protein